MRLLLKLLGTIAVLLFLPLLVLEMAMSVWYKHEIVEELQIIANEGLESTASFEDVEVSALRHFPDLTVSILGLSIKESKYEIIYAKKISLHINLLKIYEENYSLSKVEVLGTTFFAPVDSTGQKFMIKVKKTREDKPGFTILLDIPEIEIRDATIISHNKYKGNKVRISLEEGNFRLRSFDDLLEFKGNAVGVLDTMISKGKLHETGVPIAAHQSTFRINTLDNRKLFDGTLQLYDAQLRAYGLLKPVGNGNMLDITLEGDEARINDYLALIPQFKLLNLNQQNPDAQLTLTIHNSGFVDPVSFPNVDILFGLKDASFSRLGLTGTVDSVNFRGHFSNGADRNAKTSEMVIDFGKAKVNDSFFEINGSIRNFDDPYLDINARSEIELEDVKGLLDFPDLEMTGTILVLAELEGTLSTLKQTKNTKKHDFNGQIKFENVWLNKKPSNIKVENLHGKLVVKNTELTLPAIHARFNDALIHITGSTKNFMPILEQKSGEKSYAQLSINIDGLKLAEKDFESEKQEEDATDLESFAFPKFLDLICELNMKQFAYEEYNTESIKLKLVLNNDSMSLRTGHFKFDEGDLWLDAVSRPSDSGGKDYEVWLKANLNHLDTKKYLNTKKNAVKKEPSEPADYSNFTLHTDLQVKKLNHDKFELEKIRVIADIKEENIRAKRLDFNFPYGGIRSSFEMLLIDSLYQVNGNAQVALHAFNIDSIKKYYNYIKPTPQKPDSASADSTSLFAIEKFSVDLTSPQINYQNYMANNFSSSLRISNKQIRLNRASFEMFDGLISLSGQFRKDEHEEVKAFCNLKAENIDLGDVTSSFGGANKEMFSKQHFKGNVDVTGQLLLKYNHELDHQEDEMLGKINIALNDGELVHFKPISESLKFIKQTNRDTIFLTNRNLQILFHNDEILLPTTAFKTNLSNIEFSGYHSKDFAFGFDLQISVGDLLFKSQKKKKKEINSDKTASFGALKHYLQARNENGKMEIQSMKKSAYLKDLNRLDQRFQLVDSILQAMSAEIVE